MAPAIDQHTPLNDDQRLILVDVIDALDAARSEEEFRASLDGAMQRVLPHGAFACGIAEDYHATEWKSFGRRIILLHRYPAEYLEALRQPNGGFNSEALDRWRVTRAPVMADVEDETSRWWSDAWIARVKAFDMQNAAMHGFIDVKDKVASFFSFMRIRERLGERHAYVLNRLAPHLHVALMRITAAQQATTQNPPVQLGERQIEILRWLHCGKTNPEIAQLLGTTERNVKYHLGEIFQKLNVFNRTQAVAKALALGVIDI